jgi:hypothetical protein
LAQICRASRRLEACAAQNPRLKGATDENLRDGSKTETEAEIRQRGKQKSKWKTVADEDRTPALGLWAMQTENEATAGKA